MLWSVILKPYFVGDHLLLVLDNLVVELFNAAACLTNDMIVMVYRGEFEDRTAALEMMAHH